MTIAFCAADMKSTLEERIKRADDISKAYKHFRLEVAKSAEHSKTARPISERLLASLEQEGGCDVGEMAISENLLALLKREGGYDAK